MAEYGLPPGPLSAYLNVRAANDRASILDTENAARQVGIVGALSKMQQENQVRSILSSDMPEEAKQAALMKSPLGMQMVTQLATTRSKLSEMADAERKRAFFRPENLAQYTEGAKPAISLPEGVEGPTMPAQQGQLNFGRLLQDAAARGVVNPEAYATHQAQQQARIDALNARLYEIELRAQDRQLTREQQDNLARMADQTKRDMADAQRMFAAAMRQPPAPVPTDIVDPNNPNRILKIDARTGAVIGVSPKPTVEEKPLTESQGKSTLYGTRAAQSDKILNALEDNISTTGLAVKQSVQGAPLVGGVLGAVGNAMLSSEQQRVEQAQRDFVNAILRQESGAVISDAEFANAKKQYFPQPGDSADVIKQKKENRKLAIAGFARMAGGGGKDIRAIASSPLMPSSSNAQSVLDEADKILRGQ